MSGIQLGWEGDFFPGNIHILAFGAQWSPSNVDIIGTITLCPEYGGVHISEAPGMFPVGMAMGTHAVGYSCC